MRRLKIEIALTDFFELGMSFGICRELHLWPPLVTMNAFLACCVDDVTLREESSMSWESFRLAKAEYQQAVRLVDPSGRFDTLTASDGDWQQWFRLGVRILRGTK